MATIRKIIERTDRRKPNGFHEETKLLWIAQLDGKIAQNVMLMGIEELQQFNYSYPEDLDREPLITFPHDDLYDLWLDAQIDAKNGEWNQYRNAIELYNATYDYFVGWFMNVYKPAQGRVNDGMAPHSGVPQYYISAYGLAVREGYKGTLQQWLVSLQGEKGEKGDPGAQLRIGTVSTLPVGSEATASIGGSTLDPILNLGIPEGFYKTRSKAGFIYPLASDVVPDGFLLCDGAQYSRTEYLELFVAIGTLYGEGDGETTFHVPKLTSIDETVVYVIATGKETAIDVLDLIEGAQAIPLGIPYGGTGAASSAQARENLGITPENIGALNVQGGTMRGDIAMGGNTVTGLPDVKTIHNQGAANAAASVGYAKAVGFCAYGTTAEGIDVNSVGQGYYIVSSSNPVFIGSERFSSGHILTFMVYGQNTRVQLFFSNDGTAAFRVAWYGEDYGGWFKFTTAAV